MVYRNVLPEEQNRKCSEYLEFVLAFSTDYAENKGGAIQLLSENSQSVPKGMKNTNRFIEDFIKTAQVTEQIFGEQLPHKILIGEKF